MPIGKRVRADSIPITPDIITRFLAARRMKKLTNDQIATVGGCGKSSIQQLIAGKLLLRSTLEKLALGVGLTYDELVGADLPDPCPRNGDGRPEGALCSSRLGATSGQAPEAGSITALPPAGPPAESRITNDESRSLIVLDFTGYEDLLKKIETRAKAEFRTTEGEILHFANIALIWDLGMRSDR
jgi:hypothetical protein